METDWELLEKMAGVAAHSTNPDLWIVYHPSDNPDLEKAWPGPVPLDYYSRQQRGFRKK